MLSLSLQTCDVATLACSMTWHFGEFGQVIRQYPRPAACARSSTRDRDRDRPRDRVPLRVLDRVLRRPSEELLPPDAAGAVLRVVRDPDDRLAVPVGGPGTDPAAAQEDRDRCRRTTTCSPPGSPWSPGSAYNYLPFTALPLYVALERIDRRVVEAAGDLYSNRTSVFMRVIFPLAIPGIFAAFLLTFVPAAGDFVNASILGGTNNYDDRERDPGCVPESERLSDRLGALGDPDGGDADRHLRCTRRSSDRGRSRSTYERDRSCRRRASGISPSRSRRNGVGGAGGRRSSCPSTRGW